MVRELEPLSLEDFNLTAVVTMELEDLLLVVSTMEMPMESVPDFKPDSDSVVRMVKLLPLLNLEEAFRLHSSLEFSLTDQTMLSHKIKIPE